MQLIIKFNKGFIFLLCVTDIFSKYTWIVPLKDKKAITITNAFQKTLNESNCNPNKISIDKVSEFHNRSMKSWLEKNGIEMDSTDNEGESVVAQRLIKTIKDKIYKYMINNVYIDKVDDIVNKYNNTYHRKLK